MKKYLKIYRQCLKNAFSYLLIYRSDFFISLALGFGWSLTFVAIIGVFFLYTSSFNGWNRTEVVFLLFTFEFGVEFADSLGRYLNQLESNVRRGFFDAIIIKPVDSQFMSVLSRPDFTGLIFFMSYQATLLVFLIASHIQLSWLFAPAYLLLIIAANIIWLSIKTILMSINFWWQRLDNIGHLAFSIIELAKFPTSIFPPYARLVFYSLVPLAFIATVPAQAMLGRLTWVLAFGSLAVALIFAWISRIIWNKAMKAYTSASS